MRRIEIEWVQPGITVTAELTSQNPRLADLLWHELLPYNSLQNHALVSGNHLYHLVPYPELSILRPSTGRIGHGRPMAPSSSLNCNTWL
jgi:hypothetical protein